MTWQTYYENDVDLSPLKDRTVAVIGYGNQGRAQALNLREETDVDLLIGNRDDRYSELAKEDDQEVCSIAEAARRGDLVSVLLPDEVAPEVFERDIERNLSTGDIVNFAHGYNIYYDIITPPPDVGVTLVGPRMIGEAVRERFQSEEGFPTLVAVNQDPSGEALDVALALAKGIGAMKGDTGVIESSFEAETKTDLITELVMLPVILSAIRVKYELEKELDIPPEVSLTEAYLSKEMAVIFEKIAEKGILPTLGGLSPVAQYAILSRTRDFDEDSLYEFARSQTSDINDASFVHEWHVDKTLNKPKLKKLYEQTWGSELFSDERHVMDELGLKDSEMFEEDYSDLMNWLRYSE